MNNIHPSRRYMWLLLASLLLSACASRQPENPAIQLAQELNKKHPEINFSVIHSPLATPANLTDKLGLQQAIQITLSHSPQVQIQLAQLGIANAQNVQAGLISNPHISLGAMKPEGGGSWKLETGLSQPLLDLFTRSLRQQLTEDALLKTQLGLQIALQELVANTSDLYFSAVAAQQHLQIQRHLYQVTQARQQLALALLQAGNMPENNFLYFDNELRSVQQALEKRKADARHTELQLLNRLGLPSAIAISLPTQLSTVPEEKFSHAALLEQAKNNRLDLQIARQELHLLEKQRHLIAKENGWRDMEIGINAERESDGERSIGPEIEFALPVFNRGQGKIAAVDAKMARAQAQVQQYELDADTQIASSIQKMDSSKNQLKILSDALKIAEKRVTLSNREVNFMLASPFELLNIKRQEIRLAHDYTRELKNYWKARSQLELAIGQALPLPANNSNHPDSDHSTIDHSKMDHSKMDHSKMDHSNHQQNTDVEDTQKSDSHFNHQEH
jgi:cobalt-zinc-cadmium efflux system outer membrane protein